MIYFDTDHEAYQQRETIDQWGKTYLCEYSEEVYQDFVEGKLIWQNDELVVNPEYEEEHLSQLKTNKYEEALKKAYDYQENGTVEYKNCVFEMSESNRNNLRDTIEALTLVGETSTTWNDKNDELVELAIEDIQYIRLNLILGEIQKLWIVKYPYYKSLIEAAKTVEEVEAIVIDYTIEIDNEKTEEEVDDEESEEEVDSNED